MTQREKITKRLIQLLMDNTHRMFDGEYQQRVWVRREGPECDDIDDAIMDFFDDGEGIFNNYDRYGISKNQQPALAKLIELLEVFKDKYDVYLNLHATEDLIKTAEWSEIRKVAKQVLVSFD